MIELYFLIYRIPKMMSSLARERHRSAVAWSLLGISAWLGAEIFVVFSIGIVHGIGIALWEWPEEMPAGLRLVTYIAALAAAIGSLTIVRHILVTKTSEQSYPLPPPPPPSF